MAGNSRTCVGRRRRSKGVGGGLLPMAVGQSIDAVTDTQQSRASPLPQLIAFQLRYANHGDLRITSTKFIGLNPGS